MTAYDTTFHHQLGLVCDPRASDGGERLSFDQEECFLFAGDERRSSRRSFDVDRRSFDVDRRSFAIDAAGAAAPDGGGRDATASSKSLDELRARRVFARGATRRAAVTDAPRGERGTPSRSS